jgi:peptide-methionine (R)-S-oxide reductase
LESAWIRDQKILTVTQQRETANEAAKEPEMTLYQDRRTIVSALGLMGLVALFAPAGTAARKGGFAFKLSDSEWKKRLSPAAYATLRKEATEFPYTSPLNKEKRRGVFQCEGCTQPLFSSTTKYESGTGWPSFWRPLPGTTGSKTDYLLGYPRTEVHCSRCGGHLGHIFDDGPPPTGKRYCINGVALRFVAS